MFNRFINHDRNAKPVNDDKSKADLCSLLFSNFMIKNVFAKDEDVFETLDILPYQTLNEAFLAWYDEKDEIVQAQKERKKAACNLDVKKNHFNLSQNDYNDENETYLSDMLERESYCAYSHTDSNPSVCSNTYEHHIDPELQGYLDEKAKTLLLVKEKLNFEKQVNIKKHNLTVTQSNKKLKRNTLSQSQTAILDIPKNALCGNQQNGKIKEFKHSLSQQLSQNSTHTSNNSNIFTQILNEVLNNDNTVERKTAYESSDFNRSITCPGETILYLSKPVLSLDGKNMDMDKIVDLSLIHI